MTVPEPDVSVRMTDQQVTRWLRLGGLIALGTVGSLTLAIGAASFPLSGLLTNYRGKFKVHSVDPRAVAARIKCPVYLVHGTSDQVIATAHSENIYEALGGEKELWLVEGALHARMLLQCAPRALGAEDTRSFAFAVRS